MKLLSKVKAYANSNASSQIFVSSVAVSNTTNLTQSDYAALSWIEVKGLGNLGETGKSTNILTYPTWSDTVGQKAKGMTDAGSPTAEFARIPTDPGQTILRAAGAVGNNNCYAFKILRADGQVGGTGTIQYNRGLVTGPTRPNGQNEDFDLEVFTLAFVQEEIVVAPSATGVAPYVTAVPAITGTATVGQVLTCSTGTWSGDATITYTYAWFANGIQIAGATASTYTLTSAEQTKRITARVTATNGVGSSYSTTAPTTAVS